jgi:hypothetical protein
MILFWSNKPRVILGKRSPLIPLSRRPSQFSASLIGTPAQSSKQVLTPVVAVDRLETLKKSLCISRQQRRDVHTPSRWSPPLLPSLTNWFETHSIPSRGGDARQSIRRRKRALQVQRMMTASVPLRVATERTVLAIAPLIFPSLSTSPLPSLCTCTR